MKNNIKFLKILTTTGMLLFLSLSALSQVDKKFYQNQKKAFAANSKSECLSSIKFCREAMKTVPDHPVLNYLMARLNEKLGKHDIALKYLKKSVKLGYTSSIRWLKIHPLNDPLFKDLRKKNEFGEIIKIMKIQDKPVHKSRIAFIVKDKKIRTEGITYDPVEKMFYLGSDFKIVKVDASGNSVNFTRWAKDDGLGWVNGIHIDLLKECSGHVQILRKVQRSLNMTFLPEN